MCTFFMKFHIRYVIIDYLITYAVSVFSFHLHYLQMSERCVLMIFPSLSFWLHIAVLCFICIMFINNTIIHQKHFYPVYLGFKSSSSHMNTDIHSLFTDACLQVWCSSLHLPYQPIKWESQITALQPNKKLNTWVDVSRFLFFITSKVIVMMKNLIVSKESNKRN